MTALLCVFIVGITLTDDRRRRHERMLRAALRHADLTLSQSAQEATCDVSRFKRELAGVEGTLRHLFSQPDRFFQWYAVELVRVFGVPQEARRVATLALAAMGLKRMAAAQLRRAAPGDVHDRDDYRARSTAAGPVALDLFPRFDSVADAGRRTLDAAPKAPALRGRVRGRALGAASARGGNR